MATAEWQSAKQKVTSWIENEERCVTAQRVCQTLNVSRLEASQLLEEICKENKTGANKFQITTCQREETEEESVPVTGTYYCSSSRKSSYRCINSHTFFVARAILL
jgi:hypothetical protein